MRGRATNPAAWIAAGLIIGVVGLVLLAAGGDAENAHADRATALGVIVLVVAALAVGRGAWIALRR